MQWFRISQSEDPWTRMDESVRNMAIVSENIVVDYENEEEDAADWRGEHTTRKTGKTIISLSGDIRLAGRVYLRPEEGDSPEQLLTYMFEEDTPRKIVELVESKSAPLPWLKLQPKIEAKIERLDQVDVDLYDAEVSVAVSSRIIFDSKAYEDELE